MEPSESQRQDEQPEHPTSGLTVLLTSILSVYVQVEIYKQSVTRQTLQAIQENRPVSGSIALLRLQTRLELLQDVMTMLVHDLQRYTDRLGLLSTDERKSVEMFLQKVGARLN